MGAVYPTILYDGAWQPLDVCVRGVLLLEVKQSGAPSRMFVPGIGKGEAAIVLSGTACVVVPC